MIKIKDQFHIALNDIGLILKGTPTSPAYQMDQGAIFNQRYALGDRTYDDFSKFWYWAQTDFSNGIKDDPKWEDDGTYFFSKSIDAYSERGVLKLAHIMVSDSLLLTTGEEASTGDEIDIGGVLTKCIGTDDNTTSSKPKIYTKTTGSWAELASFTSHISTSQNVVSKLISRLGASWALTVGAGATTVVNSFDGSTWTDHSVYIAAGLTVTPQSSRCGVDIDGNLFVFVDSSSNHAYALVKTDVITPASSADWTKVFERTNTSGTPVCCIHRAGVIYYLVSKNPLVELHAYDIASDTDSSIAVFTGASMPTSLFVSNMMRSIGSDIIITIPSKEIWKLDSNDTLTRIFRVDTTKSSLTKGEASVDLSNGCVVSDNKLWWTNLMFDGSAFFNTGNDGSESPVLASIIFSDSDNKIYAHPSSDTYAVGQRICTIDNSSSHYYGAVANENYIVLGQFSKISGIQKIFYSTELVFKKMITGQSISVEYSTDMEFSSTMTWASLGSASYAVDGGSVSRKALIFPVNTIANRIWIRIKLASGGSDTPSLLDVVTTYLPMPFADKIWRVNVSCMNEFILPNRSRNNMTGKDVRGRLEMAWRLGRVVDFQDIDYADTTTTVGVLASDTTVSVASTANFSDYGRIVIDSEIIYYTGKTPNSFTGCLRGQKGTLPTTHALSAVIHNGYKVIIQDITGVVPVLNDIKNVEYEIGMTLREV